MKSKFIRSNTSSGLLTYQELCRAASKDASVLENLIKDYRDQVDELLDRDSFSGNTIIHFAAQYYPDSLELLIEVFGEKLLEVQNADGATAQHYAARYNPDSLALLINRFGEKVFAAKNDFGNTALHWAAKHNTESLALFIKEFGEKILEIQNDDGETVLHIAAKRNEAALALLIDVFGEKELEVKNKHHETVLYLAVQHNVDSLKFLLNVFIKKVPEVFEEKVFEVVYHHYGISLSLSSPYDKYSQELLITKFSAKVESFLETENNYYYRAVIQFAASYSIDSLKVLIKVFGENVLDVKDSYDNTVLNFAAVQNQDSLEFLINMFPKKVESLLKAQNKYGNTALHYAASHNKDSLELLIKMFPSKVESLLDIKNDHGNTALQLAAWRNKDSLQFLTDIFKEKTESLLSEKNNNGNTALHLAVADNKDSLQFLIDTFKEKVEILLCEKNNNGDIPLHFAASYNQDSLQLLTNIFKKKVESLLCQKNNNGNTVLHLAAWRNKDSLQFLMYTFKENAASLLKMKNNNGNTALHFAAAYNEDSLKFLIELYPELVKNLLKVRNNSGDIALKYAAKFYVLPETFQKNARNCVIYGEKDCIAIPGIPDVLSYYYQDHVAFLLKLRLEDAKPGALDSVDVLEASYILQENNADDIATKLSSFILNSEKNTILMPLNIGGSYLVGIAARKYGDKVVLHYMDSELNLPPESLFAKVRAELESNGYTTALRRAKVEKQNYSNCGPEVIENLTAFVSGNTRTSQEKAIPKHSTLFEEYLLQDSSKGESAGDSSTGDSNIYANIIKSMPVLSESATTLGNMLFYKISRVSDMKKSIELNIANTDLLVDVKTQAQLIYYYNTGELLPSARSMLERNSAAIQEHYKFSIANETFEVSMPDTLLADGKLEAQVLHYLRTGELFESARSALESGAVRVISQSSTVSEEEVEKTVQLQNLMCTSNRESHNDSGEALDFSEELSTHNNTGGLFDDFLDSLLNLSNNNVFKSL